MATTSPNTGTAKSPETQPQTQKITTFLWFDGNAEEAANFYISVFKNSKIRDIVRYGDSGPGPKGSVMIVDFELDGEQFTALNGGPEFKFNESISLVVHCQSQEEVDYFWEKLSAGGQQVECGWLKDKFGLSWQIVPEIFLDLLRNSDEPKRDRVMRAMMTMKKLDIKQLQEAVKG
ncbi:MAG TPA: VOC family protein [Pyrinomonadaceae bacterium]|jgi:predicted 3-demethylubiquinone-9 3-methyltransferase (glyoxalase superfamily)|nr:VOC family protein [Pyrinomonadaceae bacterium]